MRDRLVYSPFGLLAIIFLVILLWLCVTLLFLGAFSTGFTKMGFSWGDALLLLMASLVGSGVNIPLTTLESRTPVVKDTAVRCFGMVYRIPVTETVRNQTILAVNLGGAVIPVAVSVYLLLQYTQALPYATAGTITVAFVTHAVARPIRGMGIATPIFVPPLASALAAILLTHYFFCASYECLFITAYSGGVLGTLVGADLLNLRLIADLGAPVASIGGAGTIDSIFLSGMIAVLIV